MDSAGRLPFSLPFTLGHEVAGTVVGVGAGVSPDWLDEPVAVHGVWSCGQCRRCAVGRESSCLRLTGPVGGGLGRDGGLAEFMLVPSERFLVKAQGLPAEELAPLTDSGLTAYHAVAANLDAVAGEGTALVVRRRRSGPVRDPDPSESHAGHGRGGGPTSLGARTGYASGRGPRCRGPDPRCCRTRRQLAPGRGRRRPGPRLRGVGCDVGRCRRDFSLRAAAWWSSAAPGESWSLPRDPGYPGAGSSPPRSGEVAPTSRRWSRWLLAAGCRGSPRPGASRTRPSCTGGFGAARSTAERSSYPVSSSSPLSGCRSHRQH